MSTYKSEIISFRPSPRHVLELLGRGKDVVITWSSVDVTLRSTFEPRREKTGLRGFRPGPTQTDLYKHRKELEA